MVSERKLIIQALKMHHDAFFTPGVYEHSIFGKAALLLEKNPPEVKHGRWIKDGEVVVCSECGEEHAWDEYRATYCEDCGAKMDGGAENGKAD